MAQVIAVAVQEGGMPVPRGGGAKLADLCVVDRDLFSPEVEYLGDARVVLTLVDGEPVHADSVVIDS